MGFKGVSVSHLLLCFLSSGFAIGITVGSQAQASESEKSQLTNPIGNSEVQPALPAVETSTPPASLHQGHSFSTQQSLTQQLPALEQLAQGRSPFSDITQKDWAYAPISVLMQKYGCISGYPDGTFRGQQALTRNEFAAGLESCMNRMDKLIQERTANLVTREDLATLFRILSTIFENSSQNSPAKPPQTPAPQAPNQLPAPKSLPDSSP